MRAISKIIVHCSATEAGKDFHASDIDRWHKQIGWKTIGYHYVITIDGSIESGRPETEIGAHCLGQNNHSIGVCYIGGIKDKKPCDTRTDEQKHALIKLLKELKAKYPSARIYGHRDFANKDCPCFDAKNEYKTIGK